MDNLIKMYWKMNIDLCQNISLASCAAQMKYLSCFENFDMNNNYQINDDLNELDFKLTKNKFIKLCENYKIQDEIAHRETKNNININDGHEILQTFFASKKICLGKMIFKKLKQYKYEFQE